MQTDHKTNPNYASQTAPNSKKLRWYYWLLFCFVLTCTVIAQLSIPSFEDIFSSFGDDLPWLTAAVVKYRAWLFILPIYEFGMAMLITMNNKMPVEIQKTFTLIFFVDLATHLLIFLTVAFSMYLPLLKMGASVN